MPFQTANDIPSRYPVYGRSSGNTVPKTRYIPGLIMGAHDEAGTALLALEENYLNDPYRSSGTTAPGPSFVDASQLHAVDGVIVDGEVGFSGIFAATFGPKLSLDKIRKYCFALSIFGSNITMLLQFFAMSLNI